VLHAARWKYRTQKLRKKSPSAHHRTNLFDYIFATKAHIDNRKKFVKQQYFSHTSSQYGERRPANGRDRFGSLRHPTNFNKFRVLASLKPNSITLSDSNHLRTSSEPASNQLRTSSEPAIVMEFGFYCTDFAQQMSTKLCTMFGRLLGWYIVYTFSRVLAS